MEIWKYKYGNNVKIISNQHVTHPIVCNFILYLIFYGYYYRLFSCSQKIGKLERTIQNDTLFWTSMLFHANVSFSKKNWLGRLIAEELFLTINLKVFRAYISKPRQNCALKTIHYRGNIHHFFYIFGYLLFFPNIWKIKLAF